MNIYAKDDEIADLKQQVADLQKQLLQRTETLNVCAQQFIDSRQETKDLQKRLASAQASIKNMRADRGTLQARYGFLEDLAKTEGYSPIMAAPVEQFIANKIHRLETERDQALDDLAGLRENYWSIAVRLGIDAEGLTEAEGWHQCVKQIDDLQKEKARLDWMEENVDHIADVCGNPDADEPMFQVALLTKDGFDPHFGSTLREAIDAARQSHHSATNI